MATRSVILAGLSVCLVFLSWLPVGAQDQPLAELSPKYQTTIPSTMSPLATSLLPRSENTTVYTKVVSLESTIAKYAASKSIPLEQARADALIFLGLTPRIREHHFSHEQATFTRVEGDQYQISATPQYFESLPAMQRSLEFGKRQVAFHCQMFSVEVKNSKRLNAFLTPGSAEVYCSKIPEVQPVATAQQTPTEDTSSSFVSSSTVVRKNTPVTTGLITEQRLTELNEYLKESKTNVVYSPMVLAYLGQAASVSDSALRPFVVGLEAINQDNRRVGMQPVIQAIEDGSTIRVKALPRDGKIQLFSDIVISEVVGVDQMTFTGAGDKSRQSIQMPEQRLRQIHLSTMLDEGSAIMIDPNFIQYQLMYPIPVTIPVVLPRGW